MTWKLIFSQIFSKVKTKNQTNEKHAHNGAQMKRFPDQILICKCCTSKNIALPKICSDTCLETERMTSNWRMWMKPIGWNIALCTNISMSFICTWLRAFLIFKSMRTNIKQAKESIFFPASHGHVFVTYSESYPLILFSSSDVTCSL